jgi:hypothetical protein
MRPSAGNLSAKSEFNNMLNLKKRASSKLGSLEAAIQEGNRPP